MDQVILQIESEINRLSNIIQDCKKRNDDIGALKAEEDKKEWTIILSAFLQRTL